MESHCISLSKLHASNPLFLDYAENFDKVAGWYARVPRDAGEWRQRASQVAALRGYPRDLLVETLSSYQKELGASPAVFSNLSRLAAEDAVAVVSGQQVGLFGGPAYTVYKAAGAVVLAAWLREQGINAVPVFWVASNDSDFDEVRTAHFVGREGNELALRLSDSGRDLNQMTGSIPLTAAGALLSRLGEEFKDLEFGPETLHKLERAYLAPSTMGRAIAQWLSHLFREQGLILIDPTLPGLSAGLGEFYSDCVERRPQLVASLLERGSDLRKEGYDPQVSVEESEGLLFLVNSDQRTKLSFENGRYRAKGLPNFQKTPGEMREVAASQPGRLSPGVLLRPLLQDFLLPTIAYIGGPGEIAYFAQLQAIGGFFQRDLLILARPSLTLVDRKSQRLLRKYGLSLEDVLLGPREALSERIVRTTHAERLMNRLDSLETNLKEGLADVVRELESMDASVAAMACGVREKMLYQLGKLTHRFVENQKQHQPALEQHLQHLLNRLAPHGKPQERVIGFAQFQAEEGEALLGTLLPFLSPIRVCHRVCYL